LWVVAGIPAIGHVVLMLAGLSIFLVFLLAATLLARLLRGQTELARWWSSVVSATGAVYVAISLAIALPGAATAAYEGHHGAALLLLEPPLEQPAVMTDATASLSAIVMGRVRPLVLVIVYPPLNSGPDWVPAGS